MKIPDFHWPLVYPRRDSKYCPYKQQGPIRPFPMLHNAAAERFNPGNLIGGQFRTRNTMVKSKCLEIEPGSIPRPLALIHRFYKIFISPLFGNTCRFEPFCSDYAVQAISMHGVVKGSYLATKRIVRCHPWCDGGFDPVPKK